MLENMTLDELWVEILKDDVKKYPQNSPDCPTDEIILEKYVKPEKPYNSDTVKHINSCSGCYYKSILLFYKIKLIKEVILLSNILNEINIGELPANLSAEEVLKIITALKAHNFKNITENEIEHLVEISRKFPDKVFKNIIKNIPFTNIRKYTENIERIETKKHYQHIPWSVLVFDGKYGVKEGVQAGGMNFLIYNMFAEALHRLNKLLIKVISGENADPKINGNHYRYIKDIDSDEFLKKHDKKNKVRRFAKRIVKAMNKNKKKFFQDNYRVIIIHRFKINDIYEIVLHEIKIGKIYNRFKILSASPEP